MASASYYAERMKYWKNKKSDANKEKEKYIYILNEVKKLKENLPSVYNSLKDAETNFKKGGYVDEGETFDRGVLKKNYDKLEIDTKTLEELTKVYESKINELYDDIKTYQKKYNSASRNYNEMKAREINGV